MNAELISEPQVCGFFTKRHATVLADIGAALLIIKTQRGLTLVEMGEDIKKSDDTISRYIAGEKEMGVVTWLRACEAWPELPSLIAETATDRANRAKQQPLNLDLPRQRERRMTLRTFLFLKRHKKDCEARKAAAQARLQAIKFEANYYAPAQSNIAVAVKLH
jgi:hypothetical protein